MDNDGLIGVDPDDTLEVELGGAKFTVGVIPAGVWEALQARRGVAHTDAVRRAIKVLSERGEEPAELVTPADAPVPRSKADEMALQDPVFVAELVAITTEATLYGLRNHTGFLTKKHEPVPLVFEDALVGGFKVKRLAEATMRYYRPNALVMRMVYSSLWKLNQLEPVAKKV